MVIRFSALSKTRIPIRHHGEVSCHVAPHRASLRLRCRFWFPLSRATNPNIGTSTDKTINYLTLSN